MEELVVASISLCSSDNKEANIQKALSHVEQAKQLGAQWIVLPEIFSFHGPYDRIHDEAEFDGSPLLTRLSALAKNLSIHLFCGSVGERATDLEDSEVLNSKGQKRVYNTLFVFGPDGSQLGKYQKTHLFNLKNDDGTPSYCESDGFIAGKDLKTIEIDGWRIGLAICYDLRFPEFFTSLAGGEPLDAIVIPSAFTEGTGKDHWEVLLRARAIEQQSYVLASNQCGEHRPGKRSYGHSMIVDPWGQKIADTGDIEGIAIAKIARKRISDVRKKLPALQNKRLDLY